MVRVRARQRVNPRRLSPGSHESLHNVHITLESERMLYRVISAPKPPLICRLALVLSLALSHSSAAAAVKGAARLPLRFSVTEGLIQNEFFRDGEIAAHLVLTSGPAPRLVVAFPAGNSGTALWFDAASGSFPWLPHAEVAGAHRNVKEGTLRGVSAELEASGGPITIGHAIMSSVRVIRDYGYTGETPAEVMVPPQVKAKTITWQRPRLDGEAGYYLSIELLRGSISGDSENIRLLPDAGGRLRLRVT